MRLEFLGLRVVAMDDLKHIPFDELAIALSRKRALKLMGAALLGGLGALTGISTAASDADAKTCPPGFKRVCRPKKGRHRGKVCRCKKQVERPHLGKPPIRPGVCSPGEELCGPVCCPSPNSRCVNGYCICPPKGCPAGSCCSGGYICVASCPQGTSCVSGACTPS
jgi:hypothetical protein